MIKVLVIAKTGVDWGSLYSVCKQCLGHTITSTQDSSNIKPSIPNGLLINLAEMLNVNQPGKVGRESVSLARHVSYSLLIICPSNVAAEFLKYTRLHVIQRVSDDTPFTLIYASGNLGEWFNEIVMIDDPALPKAYKTVMAECELALKSDNVNIKF